VGGRGPGGYSGYLGVVIGGGQKNGLQSQKKEYGTLGGQHSASTNINLRGYCKGRESRLIREANTMGGRKVQTLVPEGEVNGIWVIGQGQYYEKELIRTKRGTGSILENQILGLTQDNWGLEQQWGIN